MSSRVIIAIPSFAQFAPLFPLPVVVLPNAGRLRPLIDQFKYDPALKPLLGSTPTAQPENRGFPSPNATSFPCRLIDGKFQRKDLTLSLCTYGCMAEQFAFSDLCELMAVGEFRGYILDDATDKAELRRVQPA
jgi:hypothetical protein